MLVPLYNTVFELTGFIKHTNMNIYNRFYNISTESYHRQNRFELCIVINLINDDGEKVHACMGEDI